jgi:hypothetical protein
MKTNLRFRFTIEISRNNERSVEYEVYCSITPFTKSLRGTPEEGGTVDEKQVFYHRKICCYYKNVYIARMEDPCPKGKSCRNCQGKGYAISKERREELDDLVEDSEVLASLQIPED